MNKEILSKLLTDPLALQVYSWMFIHVEELHNFKASEVCKELKINRFTFESILKRLITQHKLITKTTQEGNIVIGLSEEQKQPLEKTLNTNSTQTQHKEKEEKKSNQKKRINILANSSLRSELPNGRGRPEIDKILENFSEFKGHKPIDSKPRQVAFNILQICSTFAKTNGQAYLALRGTPLDAWVVYLKAWNWYRSQDFSEHTDKLFTVKQHFKKYLDISAQKLQKEAHEKTIRSEETGATESQNGDTDRVDKSQPGIQPMATIPEPKPNAPRVNQDGLQGILQGVPGIKVGGIVRVDETSPGSERLGSLERYAPGGKEIVARSPMVN